MGNANPGDFAVFEQTSQKFGPKSPAQQSNLHNRASRRSLDISALASRDQKLINTLKTNPFFKETFQKEDEADMESIKYQLQLQSTANALQFAMDFTQAYAHAHVGPMLNSSANLLQNSKIPKDKGNLQRRSVRLQMLQNQLLKKTPSNENCQGNYISKIAQTEFTAQAEFLKKGSRHRPIPLNRKSGGMKNYDLDRRVDKSSQRNSEKKLTPSLPRLSSKTSTIIVCPAKEQKPTDLESTPRFEEQREHSKRKESSNRVPKIQTTLDQKTSTISQKLAFLKEKNSIAKNKSAKSVFIDLMQNGKSTSKKFLEISTKNVKDFSSIVKDSGPSMASMPTKKNRSPVQKPAIEGLLFSFQPQDVEVPKPSDGSDRYKESENLEDAILRVSSKNKQKRENFFKENSNLSIDSQVQNQSFKKLPANYIDLNLVTKPKSSILNLEKRAVTSKRHSTHNLLGTSTTTAGFNPRALFSPETSNMDDSRLPFQIKPGFSSKNQIETSPLKQRSNSQKNFELGLSPAQLSKLSNSGKKSSKMELLKQISSNTSPIKQRAHTLDQSHTPARAENNNTINFSNYSFFKAKLGYQGREFKADSSLLKTTILERKSSSKGLDYNANHLCSNSLKKSLRSDKLTADNDKLNDFYLSSTNQSSKDTIQQTYPVSLSIKAFPANVKFNVANCFKK